MDSYFIPSSNRPGRCAERPVGMCGDLAAAARGEKEDRLMEKWISILQTHSEILTVASIVVMGLILAITLSRILKQIKRLNRSLTSITDNIQAYFDVIMQEEPQMQEEPRAQEAGGKQYMQETVPSGRKDGEPMPTEEEIKKQQEEEVFNAVLQEYFS